MKFKDKFGIKQLYHLIPHENEDNEGKSEKVAYYNLQFITAWEMKNYGGDVDSTLILFQELFHGGKYIVGQIFHDYFEGYNGLLFWKFDDNNGLSSVYEIVSEKEYQKTILEK